MSEKNIYSCELCSKEYSTILDNCIVCGGKISRVKMSSNLTHKYYLLFIIAVVLCVIISIIFIGSIFLGLNIPELSQDIQQTNQSIFSQIIVIAMPLMALVMLLLVFGIWHTLLITENGIIVISGFYNKILTRNSYQFTDIELICQKKKSKSTLIVIKINQSKKFYAFELNKILLIEQLTDKLADNEISINQFNREYSSQAKFKIREKQYVPQIIRRGKNRYSE